MQTGVRGEGAWRSLVWQGLGVLGSILMVSAEGRQRGEPRVPACFTLSRVPVALVRQEGKPRLRKGETGLKSHRSSAPGLHVQGSFSHVAVAIIAPALPSGTSQKPTKGEEHASHPNLPAPPLHLVAMAGDQLTGSTCWGHVGMLFIGVPRVLVQSP